MKAFVIRKPGDEVSEKLSSECVESALQFGITVEKFDGIYADHDLYLSQDKLFPNPSIVKKLRNSYKGCFLSHYMLWKKCIELNEPILIFEHDALMLRPITDEIISSFDTILVLDRLSRHEDYENLLNDSRNSQVFKHEKIIPFRDKIINKTHIAGSHAHLVKPKGALEMIESVKKYGYVVTDAAVNQGYITYYSIEPSIARVHPFFTLGNNRNFSHMKVY